MKTPSMEDVLALVAGAINNCDDRSRLQEFARSLERLADGADLRGARRVWDKGLSDIAIAGGSPHRLDSQTGNPGRGMREASTKVVAKALQGGRAQRELHSRTGERVRFATRDGGVLGVVQVILECSDGARIATRAEILEDISRFGGGNTQREAIADAIMDGKMRHVKVVF